MKLELKKTLFGWAPFDEKAMAYHKKYAIGDVYHFDLKHYQDQRIRKHLEKYWVMLQVVIDNQENYRTKEDLHHDIKWMLDITVVRKNLMTGEIFKEVGSVAMDKMNQEEFERFYSDAINIIMKYVLVGSTPEELDRHVMELLTFT